MFGNDYDDCNTLPITITFQRDDVQDTDTTAFGDTATEVDTVLGDGEVVEEMDELLEIKKQYQRDTVKVKRWRIMEFILFLTFGVFVSGGSFVLLRAQERRNFDDAYGQFSRTVAESAERELSQILEAMRIFSETVTATAILNNTTWPFYDYPGLSVFAEEQVLSKGIENLNLLIRLTDETRLEYMAEFQANIVERWVKEGHFRVFGNLSNLDQSGYTFDVVAISDTGEVLVPSPPEDAYYPVAFRYPPPNSYFTVGLDIKSINYDDLFFALEDMRNQTLVSNVNPYIEADEAERIYHQQFHSQLPESETSHPHSFIFHPIHAELENPNSEIVAVISIPIPWDGALRNLLPENVRGILVVTENNCGQIFTYQIDGRDAFYLGEGDFHDQDLSDKGVALDLQFHDSPNFLDYPGHCVYKLSIYPGQKFQDDYLTDTPLLLVIVIAITFGFMTCIYFCYDFAVQLRNERLVEEAARVNHIVNSMFPGELREKVIAHRTRAGLRQRHTSESIEFVVEHSELRLASVVTYDTPPLVEVYKNTTILFADIVGFTSWSSSRDPAAVFGLLEPIYNSFDLLARQQHVFKVETIGDCYVALTGFPRRQKDHAVRMCKYAASLMETFQRLVVELEPVLGPGTRGLNLRVGIHTGPTTVCILRGDRVRFQIFGDTVTVTNRMEHGGVPGKIQVSSETAEKLQIAGKGSWLTTREDKVEVKEQRFVTTYFCHPPKSRWKHSKST